MGHSIAIQLKRQQAQALAVFAANIMFQFFEIYEFHKVLQILYMYMKIHFKIANFL